MSLWLRDKGKRFLLGCTSRSALVRSNFKLYFNLVKYGYNLVKLTLSCLEFFPKLGHIWVEL